MATEDHIRLASIIKSCHKALRQLAKSHGPENAWKEHIKDSKRLTEYAEAMHSLAIIWEGRNNEQIERDRISWTIDFCTKYFFTEQIYKHKRERELRLLESYTELNKVGLPTLPAYSPPPKILRVLDVGSCYNPFAHIQNLQVTAIDLCPATESVIRGDFLQIDTGTGFSEPLLAEDGSVNSLPESYYDVIVFSLLLEYIPCPKQRLDCCHKAYKLLRPEGVLVIITPDSKHVIKNATLMKNWQYILAKMGFLRIRFDKLQHITCMGFRKAINRKVASHWAQLHFRKDWSEVMHIPQDKK